MKRRKNNIISDPSKKQKSYTINNEWICSKDLKDISMDDPFVYFLKYYKINSSIKSLTCKSIPYLCSLSGNSTACIISSNSSP